MKIKAEGLTRHHFWGTYCQTVILLFEDAVDATLALPILQRFSPSSPVVDASGTTKKSNGWVAKEKAAAIFVSGPDVAAVEAQLAAFGADPDAMGSLAHSVDRGEAFAVTFEVEDPRQVLLEFAGGAA